MDLDLDLAHRLAVENKLPLMRVPLKFLCAAFSVGLGGAGAGAFVLVCLCLKRTLRAIALAAHLFIIRSAADFPCVPLVLTLGFSICLVRGFGHLIYRNVLLAVAADALFIWLGIFFMRRVFSTGGSLSRNYCKYFALIWNPKTLFLFSTSYLLFAITLFFDSFCLFASRRAFVCVLAGNNN